MKNKRTNLSFDKIKYELNMLNAGKAVKSEQKTCSNKN